MKAGITVLTHSIGQPSAPPQKLVDIKQLIDAIEHVEKGNFYFFRIECEDKKLEILGNSSHYHLRYFESDTDHYLVNNGNNSKERIEIAGDFWPSSEVLSDYEVAKKAAIQFANTGELPNVVNWRHHHVDW